MRDIPRDEAFDNSLAFLNEGYTFISSRCDRLGSDLFSTRIMLTPVICMRGAEAAGLFYGGDKFTRVGAMPRNVMHLLQDEGSVQSLDGEAHRHRKQLFMQMMTPAGINSISGIFAEEWRRAAERWEKRRQVVLHGAAGEVLTRTAIRWVGLRLREPDVISRKQELMAMIENAGSFGPSNLWARFLRNRSERWAAGIIGGVRRGEITVDDGAPLAAIARYKDADGQALSEQIGAVELLNLLRPIVAIGRFIVFVAQALHHYPIWREAFRSGDLEPFVQEVRRFYPFFPVIGGRVRQQFTWNGYAFPEAHWVLLDLYGTNHHPKLWPNPEAFMPERFRGWAGDPDTLVPQGAGAFETDHRCPGEWITVALMKDVIRLLTRDMDYRVPAQDLTVPLDRMPTVPQSGFVITDVRPTDAYAAAATHDMSQAGTPAPVQHRENR